MRQIFATLVLLWKEASAKLAFAVSTAMWRLRLRDAAVRVLRRFATNRPQQRASALLQLGVLYMRSGEFEKALAAFHDALALKPDDALIVVEVAQLYERIGKHTEAQRYYAEALAKGADLGEEFKAELRRLAARASAVSD